MAPLARRKVAIVGFATTSRDQAPVDNSEFELWGMNNLYRQMTRPWDRWFEMHDPVKVESFYPEHWNAYKAFLNKLSGPVYMHETRPDVIPTSARFPLEEVVEKYGNYFTSTVAYAVALAIEEGFEEIHLYGIDMVGDDEYFWQRSNVEYLLGWARGAGIKIYLPPHCALLMADAIYGKPGFLEEYGHWTSVIKTRMLEVNRQRGVLVGQNQDFICRTHQMEGRIEAYNKVEEAIESPAPLSEIKTLLYQETQEAEVTRNKALKSNADVIKIICACDGALQEGEFYLSRLRSHQRGGSLLLSEP